MRDLSKPIASLLSLRLHPQVIRTGSRLHLAMLRRFNAAAILGAETLVLTTRGRSSGRPRSTPLYYVRRNNHLYIAASFAGSDAPPNWYLNLLAQPKVTVEAAGEPGSYLARELTSSEAEVIWPLLISTYHPFARYQQRTARRIPVIELTVVNSPEPRSPA